MKITKNNTPKVQFQVALKAILKYTGRTQKELADTIDVRESYVSDFFCDRASGSEDFRVNAAEFFDKTYEQMLTIGRHILCGGDPNAVLLNRKKSQDKALQDILDKWPDLSDDQCQEFAADIEAAPEDWPKRKEFERGELGEDKIEIAMTIFSEACIEKRYHPVRDDSQRLPFTDDYLAGKISEKQYWDRCQDYAIERMRIELKAYDRFGPKQTARRTHQKNKVAALNNVVKVPAKKV